MGKHIIGRVSDITAGQRKIVKVQGRSIGVFNVKGTFYALQNSCPHQAAPLCLGTVTGTVLPGKPDEYNWAREGEIIRCPWHGWEFDLTNGQSIFNPHRTRVRAYEVTVETEPDQVTALEEDESVETFPVTVEEGWVVVHV
jgi:3-phenylpropionate/trans-cinnamate dioxygenase ferredoxin subunit